MTAVVSDDGKELNDERRNASAAFPVRHAIGRRSEGLASHRIAGGLGRTRTCKQTVMSGGISISFAGFAALSVGFDGFRLTLPRLFLVRNWCGPRANRRDVAGHSLTEGASAIGRQKFGCSFLDQSRMITCSINISAALETSNPTPLHLLVAIRLRVFH